MGGVSWPKRFNVVDLGRLGSPIMARTLGAARANYFFDYVAPDIVQSHSAHSCYHDDEIFADPRFGNLYRPLDTRVTRWTRENCKSNPHSLSGYWIRSDIRKSSGLAERRLIDRMTADPSSRLLRVELERCQANQASAAGDCVYIARTAWRFLPELRRRGQADALDGIFAASRTAPFDRFLVNGWRDGRAHLEAIAFIAGNAT